MAPASWSCLRSPPPVNRLSGSRREIEIPGGSGGLEPQFHGVAALQDPVCAIVRKQSGKKTIESHLPAETLQIDPFFEGNSLEPLLKSGTKRAAGCILSFGSHLFPFRISARIGAHSESLWRASIWVFVMAPRFTASRNATLRSGRGSDPSFHTSRIVLMAFVTGTPKLVSLSSRGPHHDGDAAPSGSAFRGESSLAP